MKMWNNKAIIFAADKNALESAAAKYQYHDGLSRQQADDRAYEDYVRRCHVKAASYHFAASRRAVSLGNSNAAMRHHGLYVAHLQSLGYSQINTPPSEISSVIVDNLSPVTDFHNHEADVFLGDRRSTRRQS